MKCQGWAHRLLRDKYVCIASAERSQNAQEQHTRTYWQTILVLFVPPPHDCKLQQQHEFMRKKNKTRTFAVGGFIIFHLRLPSSLFSQFFKYFLQAPRERDVKTNHTDGSFISPSFAMHNEKEKNCITKGIFTFVCVCGTSIIIFFYIFFFLNTFLYSWIRLKMLVGGGGTDATSVHIQQFSHRLKVYNNTKKKKKSNEGDSFILKGKKTPFFGCCCWGWWNKKWILERERRCPPWSSLSVSLIVSHPHTVPLLLVWVASRATAHSTFSLFKVLFFIMFNLYYRLLNPHHHISNSR